MKISQVTVVVVGGPDPWKGTHPRGYNGIYTSKIAKIGLMQNILLI